MLTNWCFDGVLLSTFLFFLILLCLNKRLFRQYRSSAYSRKSIGCISVLTLLFCVFSFWDTDYYSYMTAVSDWGMYLQASTEVQIEPLYIFISSKLDFNYHLFRCVVWGTAFLFFFLTVKRLRINSDLTWVLFISFFLLTFSYGRVSLGMASLFCGYTWIITKSKHRITSIILGIAMITLSYFTHKSMLIIIAFIPLTFFKLNRYLLLLAIFSLPLIIGWASSHIDVLLSLELEDDYGSMMLRSANTYLEAEQTTGIATVLLRFLQYSSLYVPFFYLIFSKPAIAYGRRNDIYYKFFIYFCLILILATFFGFYMSFYSSLCYRYLYMAYIPLIILLAYLVRDRIISNRTAFYFIMLALFSNIYKLLYSLYLSSR